MHALSLSDRVNQLADAMSGTMFRQPVDCPLESCATLRNDTVELKRLKQAEAKMTGR